jgi:L,D-peptidoglycan transpeptidase YkuD (ErfK/YbiS/YcfS/YnhG family)
MRVKKIFHFFFYLFAAALVILIGYSVYVYFTNQPPVEELSKARESLALAKNKSAGKYAGETLKEAERLYKWSMKEWEAQNKKFFIFRDYSLTRDLALKSFNKSTNAGKEAKTVKDRLQGRVESELATLKKQIDKFEKYYEHLALSQATFRSFHRGKTRYLEAKIEYEKKNYQEAAKLTKKASEGITPAEKAAHIKLVEFFSNYPKWEKDTKLAFNLSKKGQTVILVDKIQSTCIILKGGKEYKTFPAEFGKSWMGDKLHAGDKATPEGVYKVTEKKGKSRTRYYKALLLNYPNNEDQKRYDKMVRNGEISRRTGIGGLIEIHGDGGKGVHWTDGCVALANNEMDIVYNQCSVNTPVIIVGSRQTLEDYLN